MEKYVNTRLATGGHEPYSCHMSVKQAFKIGLGIFVPLGILGGFLLFKGTSNIVVPVSDTLVEQPSEQTQDKESIKILFGGDIFLDRAIRRSIEKRGIDYLWEDIAPLLAEYPYKVANLEGPVVETSEAAAINSYSFAFQPEYVAKLRDLGFTAVSLANNHTLNRDWDGLRATRATLDDLKLPYFGDPGNATTSAFRIMNLNGRSVGFVGEHDLIASGQADILKLITQLKHEGHLVIVYPHWGAEYVLEIPVDEQVRAHALVNAGADLVIGAHPHVVQPIELYNGKLIFYSLGNFLFDQYFSFDTMHGLLVGMEISDDEARITLIPTEQDKTYQIHRASGTVREGMLNRIADTSLVSSSLREGIRQGSFTVPF